MKSHAGHPQRDPARLDRSGAFMIRRALFVVMCLLGAGSPAMAQVLRGTVVDSASGRLLAGAHVRVVNGQGTTVCASVTANDGAFRCHLPVVGGYRVRAARIGYTATITEPLSVDTTSVEFSVRLMLRPSPVPLDTVTVVAENVTVEKQIAWLADVGFYGRRARGFGYFLTQRQIEKQSPVVMSDALHGLPGVRVACARSTACDLLMPGATSMFVRGTCFPTIVLDGVVVRVGGVSPSDTLDNVLNPFNVEAVEVYPSPAGVPVQYAGYMSPCGAIIAWSRR